MTESDDAGDERPGVFRRAFDWTFRSRETGKVVVFQLPNLALWVFFVSALLRRFAGLDGSAKTAVEVVAFVSLMWWAIDEMARGVNPFRRGLGATVAAVTVIGLFL